MKTFVQLVFAVIVIASFTNCAGGPRGSVQHRIRYLKARKDQLSNPQRPSPSNRFKRHEHVVQTTSSTSNGNQVKIVKGPRGRPCVMVNGKPMPPPRRQQMSQNKTQQVRIINGRQCVLINNQWVPMGSSNNGQSTIYGTGGGAYQDGATFPRAYQ